MSIRGVVSNGMIVPVDPLPPTWHDGKSVVALDPELENLESIDSPLESFATALATLPELVFEDGEEMTLDQMLVEADHQAKEFVRREMDRPR